MKKRNYNGIVLFDIDGTLTSGLENEKVVQYFLDRNYAVGISTAGSIYTPFNLLSFEWMPRNLYDFMYKNKFNSFNNVGSMVLCGEYNEKTYNNETYYLRYFIKELKIILGIYKGVSLEKTASLYEITDPKNIILFDNDQYYLWGAYIYNKTYTLVPGGIPASSNNLSLQSILNNNL